MAAGPTASSIAITGANGRLGRALLAEALRRGQPATGWSRPRYDLDDPRAGARLVRTERPGMVIHSAAWTDVDGCALDPLLAMRRNRDAVRQLAVACAAAGRRLCLVSTNEVFDGERTDGRGYAEHDQRRPINAYGASKLAGEEAAAEAFERAGWPTGLVIARTAWLYGPPGNDFPTKIIAAADQLAEGLALPVVDDEVGSPTFTLDLAAAMLDLLGTSLSGPVHLVNAGQASRLDVARLVLSRVRPDRRVRPISRTTFVRPSLPPAWAVLDGRRAARAGVALRSWQEAVKAYARALT